MRAKLTKLLLHDMQCTFGHAAPQRPPVRLPNKATECKSVGFNQRYWR